MNPLVLQSDFVHADGAVSVMYRLAEANHQDSFSRAYNVGNAISWKLSLKKAPRLVYDA